jgi:hypothetical protein
MPIGKHCPRIRDQGKNKVGILMMVEERSRDTTVNKPTPKGIRIG